MGGWERLAQTLGEHDPAELSRALHLRRIAELHRLEHPRDDGTFHYGQFAEHIQRFPACSGSSPSGTVHARFRRTVIPDRTSMSASGARGRSGFSHPDQLEDLLLPPRTR